MQPTFAILAVFCAVAVFGEPIDLQPQIDAAAEIGGGEVRIAAGEHEVKPFVLRSNVTLDLAEGARLLASTNVADYAKELGARCFVYAENATNVAIVGKGILDGRGSVFREMNDQRGEQQPRALPILMRFSRCRGLRLEGFRYTNPGAWGCHLRNCDGVKVKGVSCFNYCNKTNDGLDIESCNVTVEDCDLFADDDSLCFKTESDKSFPVTNVVVRNCRMGSICNAIKFGTGSYCDFRDILIENCELRRSPGAWRWDWRSSMPGVTNRYCGIAGLALEVVDGGRMENVTIRNIKMEGYMTPIFIRHHHRHESNGGMVDACLHNVIIENVTGSADGRIASSITGVPAKDGASARRPRDITLRNIRLTVPGGGTEPEAKAIVPENDGAYPEAFMFNRMALPAYGFFVRHADNVTFENVDIVPTAPDAREKFVFDDCYGCIVADANRTATVLSGKGWDAVDGAVRGELSARTLPKAAGTSSYDGVFAEVCAADKSCDEAWRKCSTKEELFAHGRKVREDFVKALGGFPNERCPLNAKTVGVARRDGYVVEKVLFESWPGIHVAANLFLPDDPKYKAPYPAVLLPCGHADEGKGSPVYRRGAVLAAKAGMACLIYDPYDQGERMQGKLRNVFAHNYAGALAALLGGGMARYRIWDGIRALDYLETRPEVDVSRMGVMGNSGGGTMTSLLMAVEPRLKAACPSCYISTYSASAESVGPGDAEQNTFGQLAIGVNNASFALMQSPLSVRFMFCHGDIFPFEGSLKAYSLVSEIAGKFGLSEHYGMTDVDGEHGWKESTRTSSVEWMRRWLCGDKDAFRHDLAGYRALDKSFDPKKCDMGYSRDECLCCPEGKVLDIPGERTIYDLIRGEFAAALASRRGKATADEVRRIAGIREPGEEKVVRREMLRKTIEGGIETVRYSYTWPNGITLPVVLFVPPNRGKVSTPLLVTGDGAKGERADCVCAALRDGRVVATADLAGHGEVDGFHVRFYGAKENEEGMAVQLYALGKSLVGVQAGELLEIAQDMKSMFGEPVEVSAFGRVCIASAHGRFVRPDLVCGLRMVSPPPSWAESVENASRVPFCNVVNGALRAYDWFDLARMHGHQSRGGEGKCNSRPSSASGGHAATNLTSLVSLMLEKPQLLCGDSDIGRTVRDSLFNEIVRQDRAADAAWVACDTKEMLAARQRDVREKVIAAIGGFPEKTPLNAQITGRVKKDGYVIEKVLFESRPKHYVTAHLFLPDAPKYKPPYPGVVSPCGHSFDGKNAPWYQRVGVTGATHGLATLVYDPIDQGERRQHPKCQLSCGGHNNIGYRAMLLGWNTAQFRIWDGIRACDYLASRQDVDAAKLGVTGLSGGGTLSSYLNSLDPRYAAGAPAGFISTVRDVYDNIGGQDAEQFLFGQLKIGFNHLGIVALRAPTPTMIVATHGDYFPFKGSIDTYENAKHLYSMLGVPERVYLMETAGPHHWYESTRNAAMLWIRRWAAGDAKAWPCDLVELRRRDIGFAYAPGNSGVASEKATVRNVTKTGQVMDIPDARSVYDVMKDELTRLDAKRVSPTAEVIGAVAGIRPLSALVAEPVAAVEIPATDGCAVRLVLSRDDDLVPIPMVTFLPKTGKGDPLLLFTDGARGTLTADIRSALSEGRAVAVAEMRGFGETAKGRHSFYGSKRPDEEMAVMAIAAGENLVARRAEDAALAARHFALLSGTRRVALAAHGAAAIPAAHAYCLERSLFSSFELKNPPPSWRRVVEDETLQFSFADTVYGALKVYDWTDLAETGK